MIMKWKYLTPPPDNPESDSDDYENNASSEENVEETEDESEEDGEHYMVYQGENNGIENNIHLPQIPIINYIGDVEHKEDFGWEWTEKDPGLSCGPFIGQPGLLIAGFFNLLFNNSMWTLLAQQTNIYARQMIQHLRCIIFDLIIYFYKICSKTFFLLFPSFSQCSKCSSYIPHLFMIFHL